MTQYFFILGKNPALSLAEIQAIWSGFEIVQLTDDVLIADFDQEIDLDLAIKRLGGSIKVGKVIGYFDGKVRPADLIKYLENNDNKIFFGFSYYNLGVDNGSFQSMVKNSQRLGLELKKIIKQEYGVGARLVEGQGEALSSVIVAKNKLLTRGKEFNLFVSPGQVLLGETVAVQDFKSYGERDFGRPGRDDLSGMLPPKLAKMMLNLAQADLDDTILDPFCGSGTVLQEAILLGYHNLIGSDISDKAIADTKKNLAWLEDQGLARNFKANIFQSDILEIDSKIPASSVDVIVAEPYLGPPRFHDNQIDKIIGELSPLYLKAFENLKKILSPGGRVVLVFPSWRVGGGVKYLPIAEKIEKLGFKQIKFENNFENESRSGLVYGRESHRILREIWVWKNN